MNTTIDTRPKCVCPICRTEVGIIRHFDAKIVAEHRDGRRKCKFSNAVITAVEKAIEATRKTA